MGNWQTVPIVSKGGGRTFPIAAENPGDFYEELLTK